MKEDFQKNLFWLKKFFINYFWLGIVLLLVSILIDFAYPPEKIAHWLSIVNKLIESIGGSILIASIFTFASGSSEFVDKIKLLLEDIVVKRNFLANIDPEGKKEALKSLIQPSTSEKNKYPNIGDYYGYFISRPGIIHPWARAVSFDGLLTISKTRATNSFHFWGMPASLLRRK